jgi:hypothetical protein
MAKIKKCPECDCVMKCTAWHFEEDVGDIQGTGDFDCRNCDYMANNEVDDVLTVSGYSTSLFESAPEEITFDSFLDEHLDET